MRTIKPQSIKSDNPKEASVRIIGKNSPTNKPVAPKNSKPTVINPIFSKLNRLNSFFMWEDMK